jgi:ketosteroid isomerase-like protein
LPGFLAFFALRRSQATARKFVRQALQAYEQAWSRHDERAVAGFYNEPAMRLGKGGPAVRATRSDQEIFFEGYLRGFVERGYECSECEELDVRLLESRTAIASGISACYRADGSVLETVALTYHLWQGAEGWKIFLSATHAPESVLRLC